MKTIPFLITLFCCTICCAQSDLETPTNPLKYGVSVGINYSILNQENVSAVDDDIRNGVGLNLGIFAECPLTRWMSFTPRAGISFNNSKIVHSGSNNEELTYGLMPITAELRGHFVFNSSRSKLAPYVFFGPNLRVPLNNRFDGMEEFSNKTSLALDFGVGLEKALSNMSIAPELRYSYGLTDVNDKSRFDQAFMHTVSLLVNFKG